MYESGGQCPPPAFRTMLTTVNETGTIGAALSQTVAAMRAADAMQFGMIAEQLFETSWLLDRRKLYRGMTKDQARGAFKADFAKELQERTAALPTVTIEAGSVSGALRSAIANLKATDEGMSELTEQAINLRLETEGLA